MTSVAKYTDMLRRHGAETGAEALRQAMDEADAAAETSCLSMTKARDSKALALDAERLTLALHYRLAEATGGRCAALWGEALGCSLDLLHDHAAAARAFQTAAGLATKVEERIDYGMNAMRAAEAARVCPSRPPPLPTRPLAGAVAAAFEAPQERPPAASSAPVARLRDPGGPLGRSALVAALTDALRTSVVTALARATASHLGADQMATWIASVLWRGPYALLVTDGEDE